MLINPVLSFTRVLANFCRFCNRNTNVVAVEILLLFFTILTSHLCFLPFWYARTQVGTILLVISGYYLLLNFCFNFYMTIWTLPGFVEEPQFIPIKEAIYCKQCKKARPLRAHHCQLCKKCVLKMDHHCCFVNNCIGHYNHRYFYLAIVYFSFGSLLVFLCGIEILIGILQNDLFPLFWHYYNNFYNPKKDPLNKIPSIEIDTYPVSFSMSNLAYDFWILIIEFLCFVSFLFFGIFSIIHTIYISKGMTLVESMVLKKDLKEYSFNHGFKKNWKIFLGLEQTNKTFWRHILFPSSHQVSGNGYNWQYKSRENLKANICSEGYI